MKNSLKNIFFPNVFISEVFKKAGWNLDRNISIEEYCLVLCNEKMEASEEAKKIFSNIGELKVTQNNILEFDSRLISFPGKDKHNHPIFEKEAGQKLCWIGNSSTHSWGKGFIYIGENGSCFIEAENGDIYTNKLNGIKSLFGILNGKANIV